MCLLQHHEQICLMHEGGMKASAHSWWKRRNPDFTPSTVTYALSMTQVLDVSAQIAVRYIEEERTEIIGYRGFSRDAKKVDAP